MASFVLPEAQGTNRPVALVTDQLTVPVGFAPLLEVTAGATSPLSVTAFDVTVGLAVGEMAIVVDPVFTTCRPTAGSPGTVLNVSVDGACPSGATGDQSRRTATGAMATPAISARRPPRTIRRRLMRRAIGTDVSS